MTKIPSVEERVDNIDQIRSENTFTTTVFLEVRREDLIKAFTADRTTEREAGAIESETERQIIMDTVTMLHEQDEMQDTAFCKLRDLLHGFALNPPTK